MQSVALIAVRNNTATVPGCCTNVVFGVWKLIDHSEKANISLTECSSGISKKRCLRNEQKNIYLQIRLHCNTLELF